MRSSLEDRPLTFTGEQVGKIVAHLATLGFDVPAPVPSGDAWSVADAAQALGVPRETVLRGLAGLAQLPFVDLRELGPAPAAVAEVPEALARRFRCLPMYLNGPEITVALGYPRPWRELDDITAQLPGRDVVFVLGDAPLLARLIDLCYPSAAQEAVARHLQAVGGLQGGPGELRELGEQPPIIDMVDAVLARAIATNASDVHVEAFAHECRVRYRVDGRMRLAFVYAPQLHEAMIARIKIMAELNILERLRPQDGRLTARDGDVVVDSRVSIVRTADGEKAVVRLLRGGMGRLRRLDDLELSASDLAGFRALLARPQGLIFVTGPTGSGKSSTLYAALDHLNAPDRNLITIEDPVEYRLDGVNQIPVRAEQGVGFAAVLRAILRQDPDVVMVGEVRDAETAQVAIRAALTGHMVLATLHANGTVETVTRLREMGIAAGELAPALLGVIAQRLVRRLCECHGYEPASADQLAAAGLGFLDAGTPLPVARGCLRCESTGFRGRVVLFELLTGTEEVKRAIVADASTAELEAAAQRAGRRPMAWGALRAVLQGLTTLDEVARAVVLPG